jgi:hypothetical protein
LKPLDEMSRGDGRSNLPAIARDPTGNRTIVICDQLAQNLGFTGKQLVQGADCVLLLAAVSFLSATTLLASQLVGQGVDFFRNGSA